MEDQTALASGVQRPLHPLCSLPIDQAPLGYSPKFRGPLELTVRVLKQWLPWRSRQALNESARLVRRTPQNMLSRGKTSDNLPMVKGPNRFRESLFRRYVWGLPSNLGHQLLKTMHGLFAQPYLPMTLPRNHIKIHLVFITKPVKFMASKGSCRINSKNTGIPKIL